MNRTDKNIDLLTERLNLISEYNYYLPNLSEEGEEKQDNAEDEDMSLADLENAEGESEGEDLNTDMEEMSDDNEVEIDVTDIVNRQEELDQSINDITQKIDTALSKITDNISSLKSDMFNNINTVTTNLKKVKQELGSEIQRRNPTPEEQLQLRSLSAYPYNLRLTDYWEPTFNYADALKNPNEKPQDSKYNVKSDEKDENEEEKEYVLKLKDIQGYNENEIKKTF